MIVDNTPYSMNSLFSEFFRKIEGVFLEVCETISGDIWEVFGGQMRENYPKQKLGKKHPKTYLRYYVILFKIALNGLFNDLGVTVLD